MPNHQHRLEQPALASSLLVLFLPAYYVEIVKVRDILKLLRSDGWSVVITVGSHRQMKHPNKPGRVTVSGHPADDIHPKTLRSILTQAGLKK
jgi:predicted RNA binding protein YcfA (HicA-like mRNA interferase family)